jgi:hypothetical protein
VTSSVLGSLARFDTSKTERLKIDYGNSPSRDPPYRALLPMKDLRTLTLSRCTSPHIFVHALHPNMSLSGDVVCPKLEELVLVLDVYGAMFSAEDVIGTLAARASRGAKPKAIRLINRNKFTEIDVLKLKEHVLHVEWGPEVDEANDGSDDGDGED